MTIELARDVEGLLQEQLRTGITTDANKFVNDLLRVLLAQQQALRITPDLEEWLLESAGEPATPLRKEDFEGVRRRALERRQSEPQ